MKIIGIIPARFSSSRFPGKPLIDIAGKTMIQRVYEQVKKTNCLSNVVVATDNQQIFDHVIEFGGQALMTSENHQSGTDRCAEVAAHFPEYQIVVNIQGDEPFINPLQIEKLVACFSKPETKIATLIKKIDKEEDLVSINTPKVLINTQHQALYFSRNSIPHLRGVENSQWLKKHTFYKHIGIYAFNSSTLQEITKLPISTLEQAEALEQLRWIENGYQIQTALTDIETIAIDTPEDLEKILPFV